MIKAWVRRWLGLDGEGGLAELLAVKDGDATRLTDRVKATEELLSKVVPVLNDHTRTLQRVGVYEQQVPSIRRVFTAMREKALREQKRRAAEAALAAPPAAPVDAVPDDVSARVAGG